MDEANNIISKNTGDPGRTVKPGSSDAGIAADTPDILAAGPVVDGSAAVKDGPVGHADPRQKFLRAGLGREDIKPIIESLLFINERPIESKEIITVLEIDRKDIESALNELVEEYRGRKSGVCIVRVAGGYQMCSAPESEPWVKKMYQERNRQKLSLPALETLAIVAYKQPVTRMEIEAIRGVNADNMVRNLTDTGLIKTEGRKEVVGRPFLYITTRKFLEYFGLNSLQDLPKLEEFSAIVAKDGLTSGANEGLTAPVAPDGAGTGTAPQENFPGVDGGGGDDDDYDEDDDDDDDDEGDGDD